MDVLTDDHPIVIEKTDEPVLCQVANHPAKTCLTREHPAHVSVLWTCGCVTVYCNMALIFMQGWPGNVVCGQCGTADVVIMHATPI